MKFNRTGIISAIAAAVVLCVGLLLIAPQFSKNDPVDETTGVLPDPRSVYNEAAAHAASCTNLSVTGTYQESTTVNGSVFSYSSERTMQRKIDASGNAQIFANETLSVGDYSVSYTYGHKEATLYITTGKKQFRSPITSNDFVSSFLPVVLLSEENYRSVTIEKNNGKYVISFTDAVAAESWTATDDVEFLYAEGSATLDGQMRLTESTYTIHYLINGVPTQKHIQSNIAYESKPFFVATWENSIPIDTPDSIRALELCCGYLMQAQSAGSVIAESILCEAFGDTLTQLTKIDGQSFGEDYLADISISSALRNSGKADAVNRKKQEIHYKDSQYIQSVDNNPPTQEAGITPQMMKTYCQDYFLSTLILSDHITGCTATENQNYLRYQFRADTDLAHMLFQRASQILYQDPTLLSVLSEAYEVDSVTAFLEIDKRTGLPVSTGISCEITHTVEDYPYTLTYDIKQTYSIPGP